MLSHVNVSRVCTGDFVGTSVLISEAGRQASVEAGR